MVESNRKTAQKGLTMVRLKNDKGEYGPTFTPDELRAFLKYAEDHNVNIAETNPKLAKTVKEWREMEQDRFLAYLRSQGVEATDLDAWECFRGGAGGAVDGIMDWPTWLQVRARGESPDSNPQAEAFPG